MRLGQWISNKKYYWFRSVAESYKNNCSIRPVILNPAIYFFRYKYTSFPIIDFGHSFGLNLSFIGFIWPNIYLVYFTCAIHICYTSWDPHVLYLFYMTILIIILSYLHIIHFTHIIFFLLNYSFSYCRAE